LFLSGFQDSGCHRRSCFQVLSGFQGLSGAFRLFRPSGFQNFNQSINQRCLACAFFSRVGAPYRITNGERLLELP
jgi:hypothetical protein